MRKFQAIEQIPDSVEQSLDSIANLTYLKAKAYDESLDYDMIKNEQVENDEKNLREGYFSSLKYFKEINDTLQQMLKS